MGGSVPAECPASEREGRQCAAGAREDRILSVTRDEVLKAALDLPPKERIAVARELAKSVPSADGELTEAEWNAIWGEEALRRLGEIESGAVKTIPGDEVMARARA